MKPYIHFGSGIVGLTECAPLPETEEILIMRPQAQCKHPVTYLLGHVKASDMHAWPLFQFCLVRHFLKVMSRVMPAFSTSTGPTSLVTWRMQAQQESQSATSQG